MKIALGLVCNGDEWMAYVRAVTEWESDLETDGFVGQKTEFPEASLNPKKQKSDSENKKMAQTYPKGVFFIVGNEFCERFSYYGMRAILVLYLTDWLKFSDNNATALYHFFIVLCYVSPLLGAIIADGFWGKYKTILYVSILYAIGNILMSFTAFPPPHPVGPIISLVLIGLGTGGIKPCVSAFGGDQFSSNQAKQLTQFFSIFYFAINVGSLCSTVITPLIRQNVHCFDTNCFPLAFGIPAMLMVTSLVLFFLGRGMYKIYPPTGNVIGNMIMCIGRAIKNKCRSHEKKENWLDYASDKYDASFIEDVRRVLRVFLMFLPLPLFWSLFDQQGSRWTLQAKKMDLVVSGWVIPPDMMQVINPIMIIVLIPLFESCVYPLFEKCKVLNKPLQRMVVGMFLASGAFIIAGFLQIRLDVSLNSATPVGHANLRFINSAPCPISITSAWNNKELEVTEASKLYDVPEGNYSVSFRSRPGEACDALSAGSETSLSAEVREGKAYDLIVYAHKAALGAQLFKHPTVNPQPEQSLVGVILLSDVALRQSANDTDYAWFISDINVANNINVEMTQFESPAMKDIHPDVYTLYVPLESSTDKRGTPLTQKVTVQNGGIYTIILRSNGTQVEMTQYVDIPPNDMSVLWQVPQYIIITTGEILFSISGLAFAYSQAPTSMKSVVQAGWLLTVAAGNIVDVIVAGVQLLPTQTAEFFFFAGLMAAVTIIFAVMSYFYKYVSTTSDYELFDELDDNTTLTPAGADENNTAIPSPNSQDSTPKDA